MQKNWLNLLIAGLACIALGYQVYTHMDWNALKSRRIFWVSVNGKNVPLHQVKVVQIPQTVYDSMAENPKWKEHLLGNKKRVLLLTWDGCPYARAFKQSLEQIFKQTAISRAYEKDIVVTGQSVEGFCKGDLAKHCPLMWILDHCMNGICIINPQTREAIEDHSKDARQVWALLTAYSSWDHTPLFEEKK